MSATGNLIGNLRILGVSQKILARLDFDFFDSINPQETFTATCNISLRVGSLYVDPRLAEAVEPVLGILRQNAHGNVHSNDPSRIN